MPRSQLIAGAHGSKALHAPHVVIIGAGFAGLNCARDLKNENVLVTVIDRRNHHLFQPLLYQVATAGLSPAQIAAPIRSVLKNAKNCEVFLDEVTDIDRESTTVKTKNKTFTYDFLVVATGAETSYYGHDEWEKWAPSLKSVEDAIEIRRRMLHAFETAETEMDPSNQSQLLNFVIVGAGPTGVELAGTIAELAMISLSKDFRHIDPGASKIYLIEAGPRILPTFPESLSQAAAKKLKDMGVEIILNERVEKIDQTHVTTNQRVIPSRSVIWAAGVQGSAAGQWLKVETKNRGRVPVNDYLRLPNDDKVYVIGDVALYREPKTGEPLPGVAPVAMQQGRYVARDIIARIKNEHSKPFKYFDKGMLATIGRSYAVAEIGQTRFRGFLAWLLWVVVHIIYLIGFRNRILVLVDWTWAYITFQRSARLIVGTEKQP